MSPKGRPTENPKTERLEIRMSKKEKEMLMQLKDEINESSTTLFISGINLLDDLKNQGDIRDLLNALWIRNDLLRCLAKDVNPAVPEKFQVIQKKSLELSLVRNHNQIVSELKKILDVL